MKVVNPFVLCTLDEATTMRKNLLASMSSDRLDVVIKRQNTSALFKTIARRNHLAMMKSIDSLATDFRMKKDRIEQALRWEQRAPSAA